tara:strand:- start:4928 stop:5389 length:462 start_codon:yes stop_codon:yes gene_type:complete
MPNPKYGIAFPFIDSQEGFYLHLNDLPQNEVRSNLIHLVLSIKGSRYFLPDFGTNLMRYIFEPLDSGTKTSIDLEIREAVKEFIPNLNINKVEVKSAEDVRQEEDLQSPDPSLTDNSFSFVGDKDKEYTLRVRIDYSIGDGVFESKDFVIINL